MTVDFEARKKEILAEIGNSDEDDSHSFSYSAGRLARVIGCANYLNPVMKWILSKGFDFPEERETEITETVNELLRNSCSASREAEDKQVECTTYFGDREIAVYIADQGPGFDHKAEIAKRKPVVATIPDNVLVGEKTLPSGTGLFCLLKYADDYAHNEAGNEVVAKFSLEAA